MCLLELNKALRHTKTLVVAHLMWNFPNLATKMIIKLPEITRLLRLSLTTLHCPFHPSLRRGVMRSYFGFVPPFLTPRVHLSTKYNMPCDPGFHFLPPSISIHPSLQLDSDPGISVISLQFLAELLWMEPRVTRCWDTRSPLDPSGLSSSLPPSLSVRQSGTIFLDSFCLPCLLIWWVQCKLSAFISSFLRTKEKKACSNCGSKFQALHFPASRRSCWCV